MKDPRKVGNSRMQKSIYTCFYSLLICVLSQQANAQEYCVTCTGPEAIYRCIVGGEATVEARSARGQFLCIKELAKSGRHASCRVDRSSSGPCDGEPRTVMFPEFPDVPSEDFVPPAQELESPFDGETEAQPPYQETSPVNPNENAEPAPEAAPKTVMEMAKGTGKNLKKAGDAVGNAAKKTWTCLSSFFSDC
jgi:hypothetical protein